jgi:hypothetical protein
MMPAAPFVTDAATLQGSFAVSTAASIASCGTPRGLCPAVRSATTAGEDPRLEARAPEREARGFAPARVPAVAGFLERLGAVRADPVLAARVPFDAVVRRSLRR